MQSEDGQKLLLKLELISDENIKTFVLACLNVAPKYFWQVPASSSGKYHPYSSLGKGGLIRHTIEAVNYGVKLCDKNSLSAIEKDKVVAALILHDTCKAGYSQIKRSSYYRVHHRLPRKHFRQCSHLIQKNVYDEIFSMVDSHMGQWFEIFPQTVNQKIVHFADYLASRKNQPITNFEKEIKPLLTYHESVLL